MNPRLLSIIVPVLRGNFLREALQSIERMDLDAEIILVDDGSTDGTADVIPTLGPSIVYFRQENAGPAAARNRGLEKASGRFIAFLDADDVWAGPHPKTALEYLQKHLDVGLVLGQVQLITGNPDSDGFEVSGSPFHTYQLGAMVARHEVFQLVGGFNEAMRSGEDVDWFLRARERGLAIATLPELSLYYRLHSGNQPHVYQRSRAGLLNAFHESLLRRRQAPVGPVRPSTHPLVSVIMPVFNGERYVAAAISSVVAQDYRPLELIVVDDGSTDRTREIVRKIPEATLLERPHGGAGAARNAGVQAAKGELLAFIDADDLWISSKLTTQVEALNADPALEAVFGHVREFLGEDTTTQSRPVPAPIPGTMLIKRDSFDRIGWFDDGECTVEGFDWYLRASEKSLRSRTVLDVLCQRRIHGANSGIANRNSDAYLRAIKSSLDRRRAAGNSPLHADQS